jgi:hypothetical protein
MAEMKGMNISRNAFIGEINSQDIATEREQPHNGANNFMHVRKMTASLDINRVISKLANLSSFLLNGVYLVNKLFANFDLMV